MLRTFYHMHMGKKIKIKIKGQLDASWRDWFDGLEISEENHTILYGDALDEAFVHGVLAKIRDLNLKLISVDIIEEAKEKQINSRSK